MKMKIRNHIAGALVLSASVAAPLSAFAGGLRGSPSSMRNQHEVAVDEDLTFLGTPDDVRELAARGGLEQVEGNANYALSGVSFPYARPEVRTFIERLSAQYRENTGQQLVITSLTRPLELQPRNAHQLSVHPAGMAVDFRVPSKLSNRIWLEKSLLGLETAGVLDVTREHLPPHYHVAVFPHEYAAYVAKKERSSQRAAVAPKPVPAAPAPVAQVVLPATVAPIEGTSDRGSNRIPAIVAAFALILVLTPRLARLPR